jgi:hypothetical protein
MDLEKKTYISQKDAEKDLRFCESGRPIASVPFEGNQFSGYYFYDRQMDGKKVRLVYEPSGKSFLFRNAFYLE